MEMLNSRENEGHLERIRKIFELENFICITQSIENLNLGFNLSRKNTITHTHFSDSISDEELNDIKNKL